MSTQLARPRLAERIRESVAKGPVLRAAEAGYGKTTLLEEALGPPGGATAWISCTHREQEPGQLLLRFLSAIRVVVPGASEAGDRLAASPVGFDPVALAQELVADLEKLLVEPLPVVLDEAEHLAGAPEPLAIVGELLRAPRHTLRVAVSTRRSLDIPLAKLRMAGRLDEFGDRRPR